ncbi:hypothetical protein [Kitasatospora sp. NPDC050543]|uniref:hypothetical protein n=1 Tax=Kitasatospora sp. NPDC050543 TaxID=3364054 RepID=UPI0037BB6C35
MTQDGYTKAEAAPFATAEQVSATLDAVTDALVRARASRYPLASLTALRAAAHPAAETLFELPVEAGRTYLSVAQLGTVVAAATARTAPTTAGAATAAALLERFGAGPVRGRGAGPEGLAMALFGLPVAGEVTDPKLRPPFTAALADLAAGQQTRVPVELASGAGAGMRLVVPPVFHALTRADAGTDLTLHLSETTEELFSGTGPAERRDFAVVAATLAELIAGSGTVFAGLSVLQANGRPTDASLVVSLTHHPLPISQLATELATTRPQAEVWTVLLPAGPAAVLVEGRTVPVPAELAEDGLRRWTVSAVVEAFVPLPDAASVLCVQLATAHTEDWELYTGVFAELLKSVQFAWDGVDGRTLAPIPAQPVAAAAPAAHAPAVPAPAPAAVPLPPAAPPAVPVATAVAADADPTVPKGTPVRIPPADFNPFAPQTDASVPAATELASAEQAPKGTPVRIPPPDFNPFAPQPPAATGTTTGTDPTVPKGTPVRIPPADFNPFAPQSGTTAAAPPAPAAAPAAPPAADPFGTVTAAQPTDPFGTTLPQATLPAPPVPPVPAAPPATPAAPAAGGDGAAPKKGTPVHVPPPDFNPFAPQAPSAAPAAPAEAAQPAAPETSPFG